MPGGSPTGRGMALAPEGAVRFAAPEAMRRFILRLTGFSPTVFRFSGIPSTIKTRPRVKRAVMEHIAARFYRWTGRLHLRAARKSN